MSKVNVTAAKKLVANYIAVEKKVIAATVKAEAKAASVLLLELKKLATAEVKMLADAIKPKKAKRKKK